MSWREAGLTRAVVRVRDSILFHPRTVSSLSALITRVWDDKVNIRGCTIDVSNPLVAPWVKSLLVWGFYEKPEGLFVRRFVDPGIPVIEFGASIGVVTSQLVRIVGANGKIIAVEADARLLPIIRRNLELNGSSGVVTLLHGAVYYDEAVDEVRMTFGETNLSGSVGAAYAAQQVSVPVRTLSDIVNEYNVESFTLVADIEGAEAGLVAAETDVLNRCDTAIVELHETRYQDRVMTVEDQVRVWLSLGYHVVARRKDVFVFKRQRAS